MPVKTANTPDKTAQLRMLSPKEAALLLGVRRRFVVDAARRGEIPYIVYRRARDGRASVFAFDLTDLEDYVARHRVTARSDSRSK